MGLAQVLYISCSILFTYVVIKMLNTLKAARVAGGAVVVRVAVHRANKQARRKQAKRAR